MDAFRRLAVFTVARDSAYVGLAGTTLMLGFSFVPELALRIGAAIALTFSIVLVLRADRLTTDGVSATEPWRVLPQAERPRGEAGRRCARSELETILLHFAKGASAAAIVLATSALIVGPPPQPDRFAALTGKPHAIVTASSLPSSAH